ncbi:hypothetical protein [Methylomonas methanica]|uniref:Uncharacterized protein n=1 Tax=Methylomonas methanica (strain DSM 25384 / MC09) TaxID=857087 RepID=G0A6H0_METMM|nr:hypothetical protein [Methylomonas methanica]AEF99271.1 hypothetical protein Metme_0832 [Methylomonas methanica MC09]
MALELKLIKELATVCVTASELAAIETLIKGELAKPAFVEQFDKMSSSISECYKVTVAVISPWLEISNEAEFNSRFDVAYADFKATYLNITNRPRVASEQAYLDYMLLREFKETQTAYPLLKITFVRLDEFIDKWITNDAWLAMTIENFVKMLYRFLTEIAEMKQKDPTDAFAIYHALMLALHPYYALL